MKIKKSNVLKILSQSTRKMETKILDAQFQHPYMGKRDLITIFPKIKQKKVFTYHSMRLWQPNKGINQLATKKVILFKKAHQK